MENEIEKETETEYKVVKIKTMKGRVITLTIFEESDTHYTGVDKFEDPVIIARKDIDSLLPIGNVRWKNE